MKKLLSVVALAAMLISAANSYALTTVSGQLTSSTTWTGEVLIQGPYFVRSGVTLTVAAGTTVYGEKASLAALIIDRGAKLVAVGTMDSPVVFTSDQPAGSQARADWGGLIINGYSTLNVTGGTKQGEGSTGTFGCTAGVDCNEADNSGTLQYVRVEYGGIQFTPDNELNGIAFQAVGSGTTVDHIQVNMSKDDCIEFFGGTVSLKYAIASACGDDSFDWTDGWRGNAQFVVVQQKGDEADRGIEADNWEFGHDALPRSNPNIYNYTLIGDPSIGSTSNRGMTIRRGTAGKLRNGIIMGFATNSGIDIDDTVTFTQATLGNLVIDNNIFYNNLRSFATDTAAYVGANNLTTDPLLGLPYDLSAPDFRPAAGSPAINGTVPVAAPPAGNTYIRTTDFIGAVDPDNDWTRAPWTSFGDAAWSDGDYDGIANGTDKCVSAYNPLQKDADNDGIGDVCDASPGCGGCGQVVCESPDADGDGSADSVDKCQVVYNPNQLDADNDGIGDCCDPSPGCGGCGAAACDTVCSR